MLYFTFYLLFAVVVVVVAIRIWVFWINYEILCFIHESMAVAAFTFAATVLYSIDWLFQMKRNK